MAASQNDNALFVMLNNGAGGFGSATTLPVRAAWDVYAADVNGDGFVDIAGSGGNCTFGPTYGAYWFRNSGGSAPSWSSANTIASSTAMAAQRMSLGDINSDGYMDAVVLWEQVCRPRCSMFISFADAKYVLRYPTTLQYGLGCGTPGNGVGYVAWYQGNGGTSWTAHNISNNAPRGGCGLQLVDFDKNGNLDVMAGGRDDGAFYFMNNVNGNGLSFSNQTIGTGITNAQTIIAYDVNRDGNFDAVGAGWSNGNIVWLV